MIQLLGTPYAGPVAILIFVVTLTLVIWQPKKLGIGFSASAGAFLAFATGIVTLDNINQVWGIVWNATFTLIALIVLSLILDEAGFFRWLALVLAQWGGGVGHRLFTLLIVLGALTTAVFTNDGTALILTPIVMEMLVELRFKTKAIVAFAMATGFIADTASLPFPTSNLTNLIVSDYFGLDVGRYALVMLPVNLVAIVISLGVLWFYFGRDLPVWYDRTLLPPPSSAIRDPLVFRYGFLALLLLLCGYFVAELLHIPTSAIAGGVALVLIAIAGRWFDRSAHPRIALSQVLRTAPWQVVLFSLGMYLVVFGLQNTQLTVGLVTLLQHLSQWGVFVSGMGVGLLAALLSCVMNNLPTVLIMNLSIQALPDLTPKVQQAMVYANIVGCGLGPKVTPMGSLATLLWLHLLARKGLKMPWGQYCRMGLALTLPVLFVTLFTLVMWLPWLTPTIQ